MIPYYLAPVVQVIYKSYTRSYIYMYAAASAGSVNGQSYRRCVCVHVLCLHNGHEESDTPKTISYLLRNIHAIAM